LACDQIAGADRQLLAVSAVADLRNSRRFIEMPPRIGNLSREVLRKGRAKICCLFLPRLTH